MESNTFERLIESAKQAAEHAEGKRSDLRTTVLPARPQPLGRDEIVGIRERLRFSQAVFAHHMNVSVKTIQSWEQGVGKPSGAALKLLNIIKKQPSLLKETV